MNYINLGSGQARFEGPEWTNVDCVSREGQIPDLIDDARTLNEIEDNSVDGIVLQHCLEHFVLPDASRVIGSCWRVLKPGGWLVVTVPNIRALGQRWLMGGIDDYIFFVNAMGAYQGEEGDCHRWHYTDSSFRALMGAQWDVQPFDWKAIAGARLAKDWWIQGWKAVKR